jgi:hypothetical protein
MEGIAPLHSAVPSELLDAHAAAATTKAAPPGNIVETALDIPGDDRELVSAAELPTTATARLKTASSSSLFSWLPWRRSKSATSAAQPSPQPPALPLVLPGALRPASMGSNSSSDDDDSESDDGIIVDGSMPTPRQS